MSNPPKQDWRPLAEQTARFGAAVAPFVDHYISTWSTYKPNWNYEDGCVWKASLDLAEVTGLRQFSDFVYREVSARVDGDGNIAGYDPGEFNIDNINPGRVLAELYRATSEPRFAKALERQFEQLANHPRTQSGNYWHKRIYPSQVWLDGLYMAQPLRCLQATLQGDSASIDDVLKQFAHVHQTLRDPASGLLFHGWDESGVERWSDPASGCSPHVWGRAIGWYVMALVDCVDYLGKDTAAAQSLAAMLVEVAEPLLRLRRDDGLWYQLLALPQQPGNYPEASASLMIAYALMKAARLGVLDANAGAAGEQALRSGIERFLVDGRLGGICGVAGLGNTPYRDGSIDYYLSEPIVKDDPKGVAALLMALAEGCRHR